MSSIIAVKAATEPEMSAVDGFDATLYKLETTIRSNAESGNYTTMGDDIVRRFGVYRRGIESAYYSPKARSNLDEAAPVTVYLSSIHKTMSGLGNSTPSGFKSFKTDVLDPMTLLLQM